MENWKEIDFIGALNEWNLKEIYNLADIWWHNYKLNPKKAMGDLRVGLLRAGGIQVEITDVPITRENLTNFGLPSDVLIFKKLFNKNFGNFLKYILQYDSWYIFNEKDLINEMLNIIHVLVYSNYNSLRAISYTTGLKIMSEVFHSENFINMENPGFEHIPPVFKLTRKIFQYSFRDRDVHLRKIPILEMILWFKDLPQPVLSFIFSSYFQYISRSLFDEKPVKIIALELVELALLKLHEENNLQKQFVEIKSNIAFNCLSNNVKIHYKSLQILNEFARCGYGLLLKEEALVCSSIYDEVYNINKEAKIYIYNKYLYNKRGTELLLEVFLLYFICVVKKPKIFIWRMIDYLITVDWNNWISAILNCSEVQKVYSIILFSEFSNQIIHGGVVSNVESFPSAEKLKDNFTKEISIHWLDLAEKYNDNMRILEHFVKVSKLFDKMQISEELNMEIGNYILKLFEEKEDISLLNECIEALKIMSDNFITKINDCFNSMKDSFLNSIMEPDGKIDLSTYKILVLLKNFVFDIELFWDNLVNMIEKVNPNIQNSIFFLLFFVIMNMKLNYVKRLAENSIDEFDMVMDVERIRSRVEFLLTYLLQTFGSNGSVNLKTLKIFGEIVKNFGSNLFSQDLTIDKFDFGNVMEKHLKTYVSLCAKLMGYNCENCKAECCSAIKLFGELIMNNKLNLTDLDHFIPYLSEKNKQHSLHVIRVIENLINKNSDLEQVISAIFLNGLIRLVESRTSLNEMRRNQNQNTFLEIFQFLQKYSFILKKGFFATYLLKFMELYIKETEHTFFNEVQEYIKSTIKQKSSVILVEEQS